MKQVRCADGNILGLLDGRTLDSQQVPHYYHEQHSMRSLQMHSSLVHRLEMENVMEGHQGCVNALAWNAKGSLLLSGSDDTNVNIWDYSTRKLVQGIYTGHSANIFCTKFMPETGDDVVVSGAGDAEVRVHRVSRLAGGKSGTTSSSEQTAIFRCHAKRVKKLAVEDGNPHVIWSASEDGTLRQHDLRESLRCPHPGASVHDCRNVLLDLRSGAKKSLQDPPRHCLDLKTCAMSPTRPHHLLIGGSDAFARLYDRRMLPPLSSVQQPTKPPPCVCYYCPAHLSDTSRSGLHLTHVTFSPNGEEVLLSYSGEHVYLMNAFTGQDDGVVYRASDVPKRSVLATVVNGTKVQPQWSRMALSNRIQRDSSWAQECRELFEEAKKEFIMGNNLYAVEATSEIVDAGGSGIGDQLRHDCLCLRASAFVKRNWKNDLHMAIRDCNEARAIYPMSAQPHHCMAEVLSSLSRHKEALDFAIRAHQLEPSDVKLSDHVAQLRALLKSDEDSKSNRTNDGDAKLERKTSIRRTISNLLFRSEPDQSEGFQDTWRGDRGDLFNDEMEMEMEIEMSVGEEDERDGEQGFLSGSSLNLRLRPKMEGRERINRDFSSGFTTSTSGANNENTAVEGEIAVDMRQRYVGHCNTGTDIKQASFLGEKGDFVASGSDDGRWFIWVKKTGRLVKMLAGDEHVVNCVQCHPFDSAVATSGMDNTIKMWAPTRRAAGTPMLGEGAQLPESTDLLRVMDTNQRLMHRQGLPMEFLHRFRSTEGAAHPFECTQS